MRRPYVKPIVPRFALRTVARLFEITPFTPWLSREMLDMVSVARKSWKWRTKRKTPKIAENSTFVTKKKKEKEKEKKRKRIFKNFFKNFVEMFK